MPNRPLRVFLCHSSADKPAVRELYQKLRAEPWIQPWLDEEDIFPGDDWDFEIKKAIRETGAIIVCLSKGSITKEGYVQREIKTALDYSDEKPEGTTYIIPIRLEECKPPERLSKWQYADYFEGNRDRALKRLLVSLKRRADSLDVKLSLSAQKPVDKLTLSNGMEFMRVPAGKFLMGSKKENKLAHDSERPQHTIDILYDYWMARYPVTNEFYNVYANAKGINHPLPGWEKKKDHPIPYTYWKDAIDYCQWLNNLFTAELPSGFFLRLPIEAEWEKAARGTDGREYPWGNIFDASKCNTREGKKNSTTPVGLYSPQGDSPYGCADMSGNVWEWTDSLMKPYPYNIKDGYVAKKAPYNTLLLRGGSFDYDGKDARCAYRLDSLFTGFEDFVGFRIVVAPPILS